MRKMDYLAGKMVIAFSKRKCFYVSLQINVARLKSAGFLEDDE